MGPEITNEHSFNEPRKRVKNPENILWFQGNS